MGRSILKSYRVTKLVPQQTIADIRRTLNWPAEWALVFTPNDDNRIILTVDDINDDRVLTVPTYPDRTFVTELDTIRGNIDNAIEAEVVFLDHADDKRWIVVEHNQTLIQALTVSLCACFPSNVVDIMMFNCTYCKTEDVIGNVTYYIQFGLDHARITVPAHIAPAFDIGLPSHRIIPDVFKEFGVK